MPLTFRLTSSQLVKVSMAFAALGEPAVSPIPALQVFEGGLVRTPSGEGMVGCACQEGLHAFWHVQVMERLMTNWTIPC